MAGKTFTVEIDADTGNVISVRAPEGLKVTTGRLTEKPIAGPISKIVIPIEFVMSTTGIRCVHTLDCRTWCW